jgi:hypothetical protein
VKDGEEFFPGEKREKNGEHQKKPQQSEPKVANSAKISKVTGRQETQMIPLLKREGDETPVRVEMLFKQNNRETNREYQGMNEYERA